MSFLEGTPMRHFLISFFLCFATFFLCSNVDAQDMVPIHPSPAPDIRTPSPSPDRLLDAPSALQQRAKPSAWKFQWRPWDDQLEDRTFRETVSSPYFIIPLVALLAVNAADIEATRASGCGEASEFGRLPSRAEQYGTDFAADLAIAGFAFAAHKLRFSYLPQGMFAYGIFVHSRGLRRGLNAHCQ
jgi:hypothetical protein